MGAKRLDVTTCPEADGINGELEACQIAITAAGGALTLDEALGVSGLAFRFVVGIDAAGRWQPGSLEKYPGAEHPGVLAAALAGFSYTRHPRNTLQELFALAQEGIEAGVPVITRGPVGPPDPSLIVGYSDDGPTKRLDVLSKFAGGQVTPIEIPPVDIPFVETDQWRNPVFVLGRGEALDADARQALIKEALGRAVEVANAPALDDVYRCGEQAYEALAASLAGDLGAVWDPEDIDEEDDPRADFLGALINELERSRRAAAAFLKSAASLSEAAAEAAAAYEKLLEPFGSLRQIFPDPFGSDEQMAHVVAALNSKEHCEAAAGWLRHLGELEAEAAGALGAQTAFG